MSASESVPVVNDRQLFQHVEAARGRAVTRLAAVFEAVADSFGVDPDVVAVRYYAWKQRLPLDPIGEWDW